MEEFNREKMTNVARVLGLDASLRKEKRETARGERFNVSLDQQDMAILMKYRYGNLSNIKSRFGLRQTVVNLQPIADIVEQQSKDKPDWIEMLGGVRPTLDNGAPNVDYYARSISFCNSAMLWSAQNGGSLDLRPLVSGLIQEAEQLGLDLTNKKYQSMFDWVKDEDLLRANLENVMAILREVRKIKPSGSNEEALKKKMVSSAGRLGPFAEMGEDE